MSSAIDDTPISPTLNSTTNQQRRDSLEKHLQTRPELQDLKDRLLYRQAIETAR